MNERKKGKVLSRICYVVGSIAVFAAACVAIFELMPRVSGTINKMAVKRSNATRDDNDWGPVIEKKKAETEEDVNDAD